MNVKRIAILAIAAHLSGCATQASNVTASYVPPSRFALMPCAQLAAEREALAAHESTLSTKQDAAANKDAALVAVSLILFWPAAFFVGQDKGNEAELARVKGERTAVERVMREKSC